jgi:hypothetical protein
VRARKAAPIRSKLDAAFHRVPPCPVSYWDKIYSAAAAETSPGPFPQKRRRVEQISSAGGKPGVKPDPPPALTDGGQIVDSPANPTMKARHSGPTKPYRDQDTADLTNPKVPGLNRLSNHHLHSHPQI